MTDTSTWPQTAATIQALSNGGDEDAHREAAETVASAILGDRSAPNIDPHEIVRRIGLPVLVNDRGWHVCPVCNVAYEHAQSLGPHMRIHWQEAGVKLSDIPSVTNGRTTCPVCGISARRGSLSAHLQGKHGTTGPEGNGIARVHGFDLDTYLSPPAKPEPPAKKAKPSYEKRQHQFVVCPHGECGAIQRRKQMPRHLESVHGVEHYEAFDVVRSLPTSRATKPVKSKLPTTGRPRVSQVVAVVEPAQRKVEVEVPAVLDYRAIAPADIAIGVVQSQINGELPTALLPDVLDYIDRTRDLVAKLRAIGAT